MFRSPLRLLFFQPRKTILLLCSGAFYPLSAIKLFSISVHLPAFLPDSVAFGELR
jgi:hypothetical protein